MRQVSLSDGKVKTISPLHFERGIKKSSYKTIEVMKIKKSKSARKNVPIQPKALRKSPNGHVMVQVRIKLRLRITLSPHKNGGDKMNQVLLNKDKDRNSLKFLPREEVEDIIARIDPSSNALSFTKCLHQETQKLDPNKA